MDLERIEALIKIIKDAQVTELSVKRDGSAVVLRKPARNGVFAAPTAGRAAEQEPEEAPDAVVTAPMVGIFHMAAGVRSIGVRVKKGQTVGAIESMKLMNDVVCQWDGNVSEIHVEDGMPVEYGQALLRLEKA